MLKYLKVAIFQNKVGKTASFSLDYGKEKEAKRNRLRAAFKKKQEKEMFRKPVPGLQVNTGLHKVFFTSLSAATAFSLMHHQQRKNW